MFLLRHLYGICRFGHQPEILGGATLSDGVQEDNSVKHGRSSEHERER